MNLKRQNEILYFCGLILYIIFSLFGETKWGVPDFVLRVLWYLVPIVLSANLLLLLSRYKKVEEYVVMFFCFVVSVIVGYNATFTKGANLLQICLVNFLLVFGAKDISYRRIIKTYLIVGGLFCAITVMASLLGVVENISDTDINRAEEVVGAADNINRYCFGYGWSTNMANHVFFIVLTYFTYVNRPLDFKEIAVSLGVLVFVWYYTGSRLSAVLIFLIILFSLYCRKKKKISLLYTKFVMYGLSLSIPFFIILSCYVTYVYDSSDMFWIATDVIPGFRPVKETM